jgi:3-isopropylmalate/(R)-2-methylmalate dehydratase large subunit
MTPATTTPWKLLFLSRAPDLVRRQLAGACLTRADAEPLRDDVSTDEITPVAILGHYDARLGDFAHTGLRCGDDNPVGTGALRRAGCSVLVAGRRYGKGSSREHSPTAEMLAGVRLVIAESFERLYRQNADNIGLFTSTDLTLADRIAQGHVPDVEELVAGREPLAAAILRAGGLLRWGRVHLAAAAPVATLPPVRPQTLVEKILTRHRLVVAGTAPDPGPGDGLFVQADWRFIHEYYTGMADTLLTRALGAGYRLHHPQQVVVFEDHSSYVQESPAHLRGGLVPLMQAMCQAQRVFADHHGLRTHRTLTDAEAALDDGSNSAGISHAMMAEHYALPGQVVVGTDSHTPHSGALGCLAFGVGTSDMASAFVTGAVRMTWPATVRVELQGTLAPGVTAKDLMLHLLALPFIREGGGIGQVFEFMGAGIAQLSVDERATLTNMCAELGGLTGIVAPDAQTLRFLQERRGVTPTLEAWMCSDPDAPVAEHLRVDLAALGPMLARPGDPGQGLAVDALPAPVRIDMAYGGSCTAGKREDFDHYHAVLAWGRAQGLRVPGHVQVFLQYGTTAVRDYCRRQGYEDTFHAMGVRLLQPSCGACANCGPGSSTRSDQITVSAINRNFPGRSGPGQVWLASPPTVMASALAGELVSWQQLRVRVQQASRRSTTSPQG